MKKIILSLLLAFAFTANVEAQDDKTVTLVVSGQGKTQEEAKQNALRSAIEQAFGTFISSETVINNDSFISDNITSLSQGSVIKFNMLSSNNLPDNSVAITLNATVSISQMQKLTESKGYTVSISGGLFGLNLKLLKLQAAAEGKVIQDMCHKSLKILENSIDFKLDVSSPKKSDIKLDLENSCNCNYSKYFKNIDNLSINEIYKIRIVVECKPNSNLDLFIDYFMSTLNAVKMSNSEIDFAKQSGSEYYKLRRITGYFQDTTFYLRNSESIKIIQSLFESATFNLVNYDIVSNGNIINYTPKYIKERKVTLDESDESDEKAENFGMTDFVQILDSSHYVFIANLFGKRRILDSHLDEHYPGDLYKTDSEFADHFILYKTDSDWVGVESNSYSRKIEHEISHSRSEEEDDKSKETPTKNNMNLRYQMFDYYLPLSEVEKLDSLKIIKHVNFPIEK